MRFELFSPFKILFYVSSRAVSLFRPPEEGEPSTTFAVSVRDSGAADFLVPEKRYLESVSVEWKPNQRVMMEWKEEEDGTGGGGLVPFYGKYIYIFLILFSCFIEFEIETV